MSGKVERAILSPDGNYLALMDGTPLKSWVVDIASGETLFESAYPLGDGRVVGFSHDSKTFIDFYEGFARYREVPGRARRRSRERRRRLLSR